MVLCNRGLKATLGNIRARLLRAGPKLALTFLAGLLPTFAVSAEPSVGIFRCDALTRIDTIVEPWDQHTRTYANGNIRIAHLDTTGEPVCCSSHLAVIIRPQALDGACFVVRQANNLGYNWIDFNDIFASYDANLGLGLSIPVYLMDGETGIASGPEAIRIRINQATSSISVE